MTPRKTGGRKVFEAFRSACLRHGLVVPGDRVLAACSGGPDSMALVALLLKLREEMPLEIHVAHLNHRLRPEARADEAFVREMTGTWVLPLTSESKNVRLFAKRRNLNLEEAGRIVRYEFLRRAAAKAGATKIATGHTLDDQAETVLMRIMRGTGLKGLSGIAPVSDGGACPVVRPLLGIGRREILAYLGEKGVPYREDETNRDRRFLRNRIRTDLLPELERNYDSRISEHLARLATLAGEEEALLEDFVRGFSRVFITRQGKEASLDLRTVSVLSPGLARRVAREFIRELKGDLRAVSYEDVDAVLRLKEGKEKRLGKGPFVRRERGSVAVKKPRRSRELFRILWDGEGIVSIEDAGMKFRGQTIREKDGARWVELRGGLRGDDRLRAVLDRDALELPLLVRGREPGDRYRPIGAPGRKKLKEALRARGISGDERERLPVFVSGGDIAWAPGLPVAEKFKVSKTTRRILVIERI